MQEDGVKVQLHFHQQLHKQPCQPWGFLNQPSLLENPTWNGWSKGRIGMMYHGVFLVWCHWHFGVQKMRRVESSRTYTERSSKHVPKLMTKTIEGAVGKHQCISMQEPSWVRWALTWEVVCSVAGPPHLVHQNEMQGSHIQTFPGKKSVPTRIQSEANLRPKLSPLFIPVHTSLGETIRLLQYWTLTSKLCCHVLVYYIAPFVEHFRSYYITVFHTQIS